MRWDNQREVEAEAERLAKANETLEEERQRILREQEAETAKQEERKKYKNKFVLIPNKPLLAIALLLPPQHALNKLRKGEYVPLHYFTNKGIWEAEEDTMATEDDILTLVQSEARPIFQSAAAVKAKECKVKDEHLTWEEFSQANYRMLNAMRQQDWLEECMIMVQDFWLALESHEWRHDPSKFRKRALLVYQGKICRDWHKTIGTLDSFSLLPLEQERLRTFHQELLDNAYIAKIEYLNTVSIVSMHNQPTNNQSFHHHISLPCPFLPFCKILLAYPSRTRTQVLTHMATLGTWAFSTMHPFGLAWPNTVFAISKQRVVISLYNILVQGKSDPTVLIPLEHPEASAHAQRQPLQKAHLSPFQRFIRCFHDKEVAFLSNRSRNRLHHLRTRQFPVHPANLHSLSRAPEACHASHSLPSQTYLG